MGWLLNIFDRFMPLRSEPIVLGGDGAWRIDGGVDEEKGRDLARLLTHTINLFPTNSVLYLEGHSMSGAVKSILEQNHLHKSCRIARGTHWPRPEVFHVPMREEIVNELAKAAQDRSPSVVCSHLHVYRDRRLLLQGYDVGWEPLYVSVTMPESRVASFCEQIGCTHKRVHSI